MVLCDDGPWAGRMFTQPTLNKMCKIKLNSDKGDVIGAEKSTRGGTIRGHESVYETETPGQQEGSEFWVAVEKYHAISSSMRLMIRGKGRREMCAYV